MFAILIYCFLSGYLVNVNRSDRLAWVVRHYLAIMIPYWIVIVPVMIANHVFQYKSVSPLMLVITVLGGNLFLTNPLYVIGWYISFVILLYTYAFFESLFDSRPILILSCMAIGVIVFVFWIGLVYYFVAFLAGLRISAWTSGWHKVGRSIIGKKVADILFVGQRYCYSFFLIHGPVLIFFVKKTSFSMPSLFLLSFLLSAVLSVVLYTASKRIQVFAADKTLKLTGKIRTRFSAV